VVDLRQLHVSRQRGRPSGFRRSAARRHDRHPGRRSVTEHAGAFGERLGHVPDHGRVHGRLRRDASGRVHVRPDQPNRGLVLHGRLPVAPRDGDVRLERRHLAAAQRRQCDRRGILRAHPQQRSERLGDARSGAVSSSQRHLETLRALDMMIQIPGVLTSAQVSEVRRLIDAAEWADGNVTSGPQAAIAKRNRQLSEDNAAAKRAGEIILDALGRHALFMAAALPAKVWPPLFNRYGGGERFGMHVDNAVRVKRGGVERLRSDLSATLFLSEPDSYEGGELTVEDTYGAHAVKLAAGDLILYPASSLHHVTPVTAGERVASFLWIQSMIRDDAQRRVLFDLDAAVQRLVPELGQAHASVVALTGTYHNLLRMWVDV